MIRLPTSKAPTPLVPALDALAALCSDVMLTAPEVARHFACTPEHLCNLRRVNKGPAWVKFSSGAVRYPLSEVLGYEMSGAAGPLTVARLALALSMMAGLSAGDREKILTHVKAVWPGLALDG